MKHQNTSRSQSLPRLARGPGYFIGTPGWKRFLRDETGQDLVEYALVVALIAMAATAGMSSMAGAISTAFSSVGSHLGTYTS